MLWLDRSSKKKRKVRFGIWSGAVLSWRAGMLWQRNCSALLSWALVRPAPLHCTPTPVFLFVWEKKALSIVLSPTPPPPPTNLCIPFHTSDRKRRRRKKTQNDGKLELNVKKAAVLSKTQNNGKLELNVKEAAVLSIVHFLSVYLLFV